MIDKYDVLYCAAVAFLFSFLFAVYEISVYIKINKELNEKIDTFDRMITAASYTIIKLEMEKKKLIKQFSQNQAGRDYR